MNQLTDAQLRQLCQTAKKAAVAAGEYIQSRFDEHYTLQHKEGGDSIASQVVTEVDFKAQEMILNTLQSSTTHYNLGLLTEEASDNQSRHDRDYFWCIDPLDGTLPFTEHRTGYAVSIALISNAGDPMIGIVYIPDLRLCYSSIKGEGVLLNDQPFRKNAMASDNLLHFYMDRSFQSEPYYEAVTVKMKQWIQERQIANTSFHADFGGVRNAIGVMSSGRGCYFKFPKEHKGGGSIWDYASTRLFFEELGLYVSNAQGEKLYLNNHQTTFMNHQGIVYATDKALSAFIIELGERLKGLS